MTAPTWQRYGDEFHLEWPDEAIRIVVSRLYESHHEVMGEFRFLSLANGEGHLHQARVNLLSSRRTDLLRHLRRRASRVPWDDVLEQACAIVVREWRTEPDFELLDPVPAGTREFLVDVYLPEGEPTLFYGDGDSGKSYFMLALALSVATGERVVPGVAVRERCPVLYCDWETSRITHAERLGALMRGAGIGDRGDLYYRKLTRQLPDLVDYLRAQVDRVHAGLVVVDSFGFACGPEPETADAAMRVFRPIQQLGVAVAVVAHVAAASVGVSGVTRPFGSVFVRNSVRWSWEIRRGDGEAAGGTIPMALLHGKHNIGPALPARGLTLVFDGDAARFEGTNVAASDLAIHLPVKQRILAALGAQDGLTNDGLYEALPGATRSRIYQECSALARAGRIVKIRDGRKVRWALPGGA